jgi:hypothetical protein
VTYQCLDLVVLQFVGERLHLLFAVLLQPCLMAVNIFSSVRPAWYGVSLVFDAGFAAALVCPLPSLP